jgi:threonine dehydrogenase-like Zn-dependent dehydrogenase
VTYDTVTNTTSLNQALRATRAGGQLVLLGLAGVAEGVDWTPSQT